MTIAAILLASLAPAEGQVRCTTVDVRDDGNRTLTFALDRTITFRGDRVELRFLPPPLPAAEGPVTRFARVYRTLARQPIVYTRDPSGGIAGVVAEESTWQRYLAAVARLGEKARRDAPMAADPAAPLRLLPAGQRRAMLIELACGVTAGNDADRVPGSHHVTVPAARYGAGEGSTLAGTETVREAGPGRLAIDTAASGTLGAARLSIARSREIDRSTGLLVGAREETVTEMSIGSRALRTRAVRTTTITPMVSRYPSAIARKP